MRTALAAPATRGAGDSTGSVQTSPGAAPFVAEINQAFRAAYNLDHDEAMTHARRAVALGAEEPEAHRALAAILWLNILFRRGAVSVDHYMGSMTKSQHSLPRPPPELTAEFKGEVARAIQLAENRLKRNPRDVQARYDLGTAYALQASYAASVDGSVTAAFRSAKRAYDAQEEVLSRDPTRVGAGLVVGIYRYIVSVFGLPTRVLAYIVGFGGGKELGIKLLEGATRDPRTNFDAKAALMLVYSREGRHHDVVTLARELRAEFPRNRLFLLEEGAAAIRAGRPAEAEATLSRGLTELERDVRPKMPGERAYWLYKRGMSLVAQRHIAAAQTDLDAALRAEPVAWVRGRIHVELGKIADLTGRRQDAIAAYRTAKTTCDASNDPICAAEAARLLRRPFGK